MPERLNKKFHRVDSTEVQGEGSWIIIRKIGFEIVLNQNAAELKNADQNMELAYQATKTVLYEWNWVDDEGTPLPQPKDDPEVFDELTVEEQLFSLRAAEFDKLGDLVADSKK